MTSMHSNTSGGARRRSVHGMKNLLPLQLLSPPLPDKSSWPSSVPNQRSTFGDISTHLHRERNPSCTESEYAQLHQYRDAPIYNEPGSPIPSLYFNENCFCSDCSRRPSLCDEYCRRDSAIGGQFDFSESEPDEVDEHNDSPRMSYVRPTRTDSLLSFQCYGENPIVDDIAWWKYTPQDFAKRHSKPSVATSTQFKTVGVRVESWLSDASSNYDEEILGYATALKPSKASIVQLDSKTSSYQSVQYRSASRPDFSHFSFPKQGTNNTERLATCDSPPESPFVTTTMKSFPRQASYKTKFHDLGPKMHLDLALPSPPLSPKSSPAPRAISPVHGSTRTCDLGIKMVSTPLDDGTLLDWPLPPQNTTRDIVSELEESVFAFPSSDLALESSVTTEIRSRLQKARFTSFNFPGASDSSVLETSYLSSPDLEPLARIFPNGSHSDFASLYAHVLALSYVESFHKRSRANTFSHKRRNTPYWATSPATIPSSATATSFPQILLPPPTYQGSNERIQSLEKQLQRCIQGLINVMEEPTDVAGASMVDLPSKTVLRSLVEVVRNSEEQLYRV